MLQRRKERPIVDKAILHRDRLNGGQLQRVIHQCAIVAVALARHVSSLAGTCPGGHGIQIRITEHDVAANSTRCTNTRPARPQGSIAQILVLRVVGTKKRDITKLQTALDLAKYIA